MMDALKNKIQQYSKSLLSEIVAYRRYIHENPELSFKEEKTAQYITSILDKYKIKYQKNIAGFGIVGEIQGKKPGKVIYLRGDMDALPITEETNASYCSKEVGVMHACGHDVHTASLIGSLIILNQLKEDFNGTIRFIFQPAEEKLPGGASLMIKEGVLDQPKGQAIFGQHVFPDLEAGKVGFKSGSYMASCDEIYLTVIGKGGHGAMPHKTIDPVLIAAHILVALQQIVSRHMNIENPTVLSFGKINGDGATNVIPNEVKIEGTFRTMNEVWRSEAHQKIEKMAKSIAQSMGGDCMVDIHKGYPCLINDVNLTDSSKKNAESYLGKENVVDLPIRMTAEDFSYYSQYMPSCFYRLGTRNEKKGIVHTVHSSKFDVDESSLEVGMGLMAWLSLNQLKDES